MKITSSMLFEKENLKRPRGYEGKKSGNVPCVSLKQPEKVNVDSLLDPDIVDFGEDLDTMHEVVMDQDNPINLGPKARQDLRVSIVKDVLEGMREIGADLPRPTFNKKALKPGGHTLCMLFSDWHYGKVIKSKSGKFIFNSEIAHSRIENEISDQVEQYIARMAPTGEIDQVKIIFAGDIVDNDIVYHTQRFQIDNGVAMQFHGVARAIMTMIAKVREALKAHGYNANIEIECLTGNHGRAGTTSKIPICSWDTAVYSAVDLAIKSAGWDDVKLTFSLEDFHVFQARGHRGLVVHHAPPQSETPSAKKKFGGWYEIFDYDFVVYGDLHHWAASCYNGKPLLMNGSLCGYDEFAIGLGVRDDWSQLIWLASDEHPVNYLHRMERKS